MQENSINNLLDKLKKSRNKPAFSVPRTGIEPAPTKVDMALNHARLPFPPSGLLEWGKNSIFYFT
jgi:hypothetical protein